MTRSLALPLALAIPLAGCPADGDSGAGDARPPLSLDAAPPDQGPGCAPEGYRRGACCDHPSGAPGVCTAAGCTLPGEPPAFDETCLALCDEQCTLGPGEVGPCCLLSDPPGTGICRGAQCLGPAGPQDSRPCAALAALPEGLGCGTRITGVLLDGGCGQDGDCDLDLRCVDDGIHARYCAPGCGAVGAQCPAFFACQEGLCVRSGRVGQDCEDSAACQSGRCIAVEGGAQYCSVPCDEATPCPSPLVCDAANQVCLRGG